MTTYQSLSPAGQALRLGEMRTLYDRLSAVERAAIDGECCRLQEKLHLCGPMMSFEIVMSIRLLLVKAVT